MSRVRYRASVWLLISQTVIGAVCLLTFDVWSLPALSVMTFVSEADPLARILGISGAAIALILYYNAGHLRMAFHTWIFTVCGMFWFSLYFYVLQILQQSEPDPLAAYERHGELIYPVTGPHWPSPLFHDRLWEGPVLSGARDLVFHAASGNADIPAVEALVILAPPVLFLAWVLALTVTTTWLSDRILLPGGSRDCSLRLDASLPRRGTDKARLPRDGRPNLPRRRGRMRRSRSIGRKHLPPLLGNGT